MNKINKFSPEVRELWQPTEAAGSPVRNYDLTDALDLFLEPAKLFTMPEYIVSTKRQIAAGDLIISHLRSYLRDTAIVLPSDGVPAVASTEFMVLRPKKELSNLPVPRALITGQATYQAAVRRMVAQRQRATRFLDAAKRAVEIAIKDPQSAALAHLAAANPPAVAV